MPSIKAKDAIEIHVDPQVVFDAVSNYKDISAWLPIYSCHYLNGEEVVEGLKVSHQYGKPPFVMSKFTRSIDTIIPGSRLEETYIDGDLRGAGIWSFDKSELGTIASYECEVTSQKMFAHITFTIFGKNAHSNVYKPLLKKLKAHCEAMIKVSEQ